MRHYLRILASAGVFCCALGPCLAQEAKPNIWAVGATIGSLGVGGEASAVMYDSLVLRANGSYLAFDAAQLSGRATDAIGCSSMDLSGGFAGAAIDWHPTHGGWRVSGGLQYANLELKGVFNSQSLGGTEYTSEQVGRITDVIRLKNAVAPYIGVGYDPAHFNTNGFGLSLSMDASILYVGGLETKITTERPADGLANAIAQEEARIDQKIKNLSIYPVLTLSGKLSF